MNSVGLPGCSEFHSNLKQTSVHLSDKSGDVPKVILMIDEMVTLLKAEQGENDGKKACCIKSFGHMEDEAKILAHQICDHREAIADYSDQLSNLHERIVEGINDVHSEEGKGWCCGAHVTGQGAHCWSETCASERVEEQTDVPVHEWVSRLSTYQFRGFGRKLVR